MRRTNLNFALDVMAFAGFIVLTTTGVLVRYLLPPGSGRNSTIWNLDRHEWGNLHFWISVGFFLILALHLVLHWRWIVCTLTGRPREGSGLRAGLGIVGLITISALAISPLLSPVERVAREAGASSLSIHKLDDVSIRGSMTLQEVEAATGVPAAYILKSLGLPETTAEGAQLSHLKRQYGFEISDVRAIVKRYEDGK